ncbi:MAG: phospholipid-binding protein [Cyanobacteria bacterium P01_D01_bin.128]
MGVSGNRLLATGLKFQSAEFRQTDLMSTAIADVNKRFCAIPLERVGLKGEYDYQGLAKRVSHRLKCAFGIEAIAELSIFQRGRVVILHGKVLSQQLLSSLIQAAMEEPGADYVELRGVVVAQSPSSAS